MFRGLLIGLILLTGIQVSSAAHLPGILLADDLQNDAALAKQTSKPIVLMISRDHCPYCTLLKREVLQPMGLNENYQNRIIVREVLIDKGSMITNFQGKRQAAKEFSQTYGIQFTPTLLFLDSEGKELTKRLVGINTVELFSFYLDAAIDEARNSLLTQNAKQ